jgi:hypothetical protein
VTGSQNSAVGVAPRLHVGRLTIRLSNYGRIKTPFCFWKHPDLTDTHQASYLRATDVLSPGVKRMRYEVDIHQISRVRMNGDIFHLPHIIYNVYRRKMS